MNKKKQRNTKMGHGGTTGKQGVGNTKCVRLMGSKAQWGWLQAWGLKPNAGIIAMDSFRAQCH